MPILTGFDDPLPRRKNENWPDPTSEMMDDPIFNAIWEAIRTWDINAPDAYWGYMSATGNHVRAIYDSVMKTAAEQIEKIEESLEDDSHTNGYG